MNECNAYVGPDAHKGTIAVAVALSGRGESVYRGEIKNQRKSLLRLVRALSSNGEVVSFCYEVGSCVLQFGDKPGGLLSITSASPTS